MCIDYFPLICDIICSMMKSMSMLYVCKHAMNDNSTEMSKFAYNFKRLLTDNLATDITEQ